MPEQESAIIIRHADKGKWEINKGDLLSHLPEAQANLVMTTLSEEFPDWKETPITIDGIVRSFKLAENIFADLPQKSILLATDSGKDRARLTRALTTARLEQLEQEDKQHNQENPKQVDMLKIPAKEITDLLADASPDTWPPYDEMMAKEGISESEAIARWLNDMNRPEANVPAEISPKEASQRYHDLIKIIQERVKSKDAPVILFGVGHSGSLGQIRYENLGREAKAADTPEFCEMFKFDKEGNLLETKGVEL